MEVFGGSGVFVAVFGTLVEVGVRVTGRVVAVATGVLVAVALGSDSGAGSVAVAVAGAVAGAVVSSGCGGGSEPTVLVAGAASAVAVGGIPTPMGVGVFPAGGMRDSSTMTSGVWASSCGAAGVFWRMDISAVICRIISGSSGANRRSSFRS